MVSSVAPQATVASHGLIKAIKIVGREHIIQLTLLRNGIEFHLDGFTDEGPNRCNIHTAQDIAAMCAGVGDDVIALCHVDYHYVSFPAWVILQRLRQLGHIELVRPLIDLQPHRVWMIVLITVPTLHVTPVWR